MEDSGRFKAVTPCYSGGGIYIFTGSLSNGDYFISSSDMYDIRLINVNPDDYDLCEEVCMAEWQEEHLVRDYECGSDESRQFILDMFEWILEHRPEGDYLESDILILKDELLKEREG